MDGNLGVNIISEEVWARLGLPKPQVAPYRLPMAVQALVDPISLIRDVQITVLGIPYQVALTVIKTKAVNNAYSMLLGRPWLVAVKVTHDWRFH